MTTTQERWELEEVKLSRARQGIFDGEFRLVDAVCEESVNDLIIDLKAFYKLYEPRPIELEIMTRGGSFMAGIALHDTLRWMSNEGYPVTTYISGLAGSMGGVIAQAGDHRVIGRRSALHMHAVHSDVTGNSAKMLESALDAAESTKQVARIYAERSGLTFSRVHGWISKGAEVNYIADEALELNLVDEIRGF